MDRKDHDNRHEQAQQLEASVTSYDSQFKAFQESLDNRNRQFSDWMQSVEVLQESLGVQQMRVEELTGQAETMLTGATNAGLASTFSHKRDNLEAQLRSAQRTFYAAILFLTVSVLPLAAFVFPGLGSVFGIVKPVGTENLLAEAGLRLVLQIPRLTGL